MAASNGATVTASAPPIPAAKQATVVRNRFTHGSRRVIVAGAVAEESAPPPLADYADLASAPEALLLVQLQRWSWSLATPQVANSNVGVWDPTGR